MTSPGAGESAPRWTPLALLLLGAGAAFLLLGLVLRSSAPIFVGLPLLLVPVAAALSGPRRPLRATLAWLSTGAEADVRIVGAVRAEAGASTTELVLALDRPADLDPVEPLRAYRSGGQLGFDLRWRAPFPTISFVAPPRAVWRDPIGLVERPVELAAAPLVIERYPAELLRLEAVRLEHVLALPGETRSRRPGSAGEFYGIREAAPTDPPRLINWRATARWGRRLANEFLLDRTGDVLILIDARPTRLGPATDEILLGAARAAAVGIAEAFTREKARVGYASFGEFVTAVPLSSGRGHRLRVREAIRATTVAPAIGPSERCAAGLSRFFPPGVTTILISSLTGDADADVVPFLRRRGYPTVVLSPSPYPIQPVERSLDPADAAMATRIDRMVRRQSLAAVWTHAPVVDWEDFWSLGGFVRMLRQPARRRSV